MKLSINTSPWPESICLPLFLLRRQRESIIFIFLLHVDTTWTWFIYLYILLSNFYNTLFTSSQYIVYLAASFLTVVFITCGKSSFKDANGWAYYYWAYFHRNWIKLFLSFSFYNYIFLSRSGCQRLVSVICYLLKYFLLPFRGNLWLHKFVFSSPLGLYSFISFLYLFSFLFTRNFFIS